MVPLHDSRSEAGPEANLKPPADGPRTLRAGVAAAYSAIAAPTPAVEVAATPS